MDKAEFEHNLKSNEYTERYARFLLAEIYKNKFSHAQQSDRPDIQYSGAGSEGIEVTSLSNVYVNTLKRYKRIWTKNNMTLEDIVSSLPSVLQGSLTINKHGSIVLLESLGKISSVQKCQQDIVETVSIKLNKLQNYKKFSKNNLIIFATNLNNLCDADRINEALQSIDKNNFATVFDNILVATFDTLLVFPFNKNGRIQIIGIDKEIREFCNYKAIQSMPTILPNNKKKHDNNSTLEPEK